MGHTKGTDIKHLTKPGLKPISWKLKTRAETYTVSGLDSGSNVDRVDVGPS
jgi:hypothetical protein